ncbi:MAG: S1C family serine protease [Lachnospiraceae bacterium]|nr:S1C family serine protease [Lachnospiraceae bacterium]
MSRLSADYSENTVADIDNSTEFKNIQEKVKQRPLNRRKLLRRTIITASMAVIFGVLACITFLVLEPVFSNILHPEEEPEIVEIPGDTADEISPEDMMLEEEQPEPSIQIIEKTETIDPIDMYKQQYNNMYRVAMEVRRSMVTVTSVNQDTDWFNNQYENKGNSSGLYVANNGRELLILCRSEAIEQAETLYITFNDSTVATGTVKGSDSNTGLSVVAVQIADLDAELVDKLVPAMLGSSRSSGIIGIPVIAIGRPYSNSESVGYGMITSKGNIISKSDQNYERLTTDIYGSMDATGILVNLSGEVLGIIDQSYNEEDMENIISALAISDLKQTIERMSNGRSKAYLGINGFDVSREANEMWGVPYGAYVTGIVMDSPAMNAGIQSGDVIVSIDDTEITKFSDYTDYLDGKAPESVVFVSLLRQSGEEYREITLEVTLEEAK